MGDTFVKMGELLIAFFLVGLLATSSAPVSAQIDREFARDRLLMLSDFANTICVMPQDHGTRSSRDYEARVGAGLTRFLKSLAEAKFTVATKGQQQAHDGLLQADLLAARKVAVDCRLGIVELMSKALFDTPEWLTLSESNRHKRGPSFDCAGASKRAEELLCSSRDLAILDWAMDNSYREVLAQAADARELQRWKQSQRTWIKKIRDNCTTNGCLERSYQQRIGTLKKAYRKRR